MVHTPGSGEILLKASWRRSIRWTGWLGLVLVGALLVPSAASGQQVFSLKSWNEPTVDVCSGVASELPGTPAPASPDARARVDSLLAAGSQAAILGELVTARDLFRTAAELDPANSVVAYRLARALDESDQTTEAISEYCRYLTLAPGETTAAVVRDRVHVLGSTGEGPPRAPWSIAMSEGFQAYEAGRYRDAIQAFTRVVELRPDLPEAYFNRAAAFTADSRPEFAVNDFQTYLTLDPAAADAQAVREQLSVLHAEVEQTAEIRLVQTRIARPGIAFAQGLVIPGLGQHATGRTGLGVVVLAASAGAVYYGLRQHEVVRTHGATDPFGNYYEYEATSIERPYQIHGISAAAAIALLSAIESFIYSDRQYRRIQTANAPLPPISRPETTSCPAPPDRDPSLFGPPRAACESIALRSWDSCSGDSPAPPMRRCSPLAVRPAPSP